MRVITKQQFPVFGAVRDRPPPGKFSLLILINDYWHKGGSPCFWDTRSSRGLGTPRFDRLSSSSSLPCWPLLIIHRVRISDVPSHLHYIMLELIKNSMRATVDFHGLDEMDKNPIRVVIADGEENEVWSSNNCTRHRGRAAAPAARYFAFFYALISGQTTLSTLFIPYWWYAILTL